MNGNDDPVPCRNNCGEYLDTFTHQHRKYNGFCKDCFEKSIKGLKARLKKSNNLLQESLELLKVECEGCEYMELGECQNADTCGDAFLIKEIDEFLDREGDQR